MTIKEHQLIWNRLQELANYDEDLMKEAQENATDTSGRVCLQSMKQHILIQTNPALMATLDAAHDFAKAVNYNEGILSLPHLPRIYELAKRDATLPRTIFTEAVNQSPTSSAPAPDAAIGAIVRRHEIALSSH